MKAEFWHDKWEKKEIAFHQSDPNPLLLKYFSRLDLTPEARVFVPLCGKSVDIHWILEQGHRVAGAELSETAITELFEELGLTPTMTLRGNLRHYSTPRLEVFAGDIFELQAQALGEVQAVYDRAAMVALPESTRPKYAAHLKEITGCAPQLLITFLYDQALMEGPPFSIPGAELETHYASDYHIEQLESRAVEGKLKGQVEATETIRLLR